MGFRAPTGYGTQCALFAPKIAKHHDLMISAFYGLDGNLLEMEHFKVFPGVEGTFGNETIEAACRYHFDGDEKAGLTLTLLDVWVLKPEIWRQLRTACWVPVDHDPAPPAVLRHFEQTGAVPIAMSRFGEERLQDFDPLYCPHGVDTDVFTPVEKKLARKNGGLPKDAFIVGMVAANKGNPSRKSFPEALQAFKLFQERHDDALLYLHTDISGRYGVNLVELMERIGIPASAVHITEQERYHYRPFPDKMMAHVYSSLDVLLNPARGEGFGLPILEAQACGTPVIVTDFSAMQEVCGAGWRVEYEPEMTAQMSWQALPKIEDILESLEACYRMPEGQRQALSVQARQHAEKYDAELVFEEHMLPALAEAAERLGVVKKPKKKVAA